VKENFLARLRVKRKAANLLPLDGPFTKEGVDHFPKLQYILLAMTRLNIFVDKI
jgi:hypothetical protein